MVTATPESLGISSRRIKEYIEVLEKTGLSTHDIIIARGGEIAFETYWKPFHKDFLHRMYSVTKSFVALAVGFLEQDGLVNLDVPISKYFPEEIKDQPDENMRNQTIRHMLMMSTAKVEQYWFDKPVHEDRVKFYFENNNVSRPSGTIFQYDSMGSFVVGAMVERITGKTLMEYLREKFMDEIGVSKEAFMLKCPGGHSWGDSALVCKPMDLMKVAQFTLNGGRWNGKQILNEKFVKDATSCLITNCALGDEEHNAFGYGYYIWRTERNSFFFNGMGCQFAICSPDKDMIFVYNADNQGKDYAKKVIIDNYFDIIYDNVTQGAIPEDEAASKELADYCSTLELAHAKGESHVPFMDEINGVQYKVAPNPMGITELKLEFAGDEGKLCYTNAQGYKELKFGMCKNVFDRFPEDGYSDEVGGQKGTNGLRYACAASAAWLEPRKLYIKVQVIDKYLGILNIFLGYREDGKLGIFMNKTAEDFFREYEGYACGEPV